MQREQSVTSLWRRITTPLGGSEKAGPPQGEPTQPAVPAQPEPVASKASAPSVAVDKLANQLSLWSQGIGYEIGFWEKWHATEGDQWPEDFIDRQRTDIDNPDWLLRYLGIDHDPTAARILDVGAGPLTVLRPTHRGQRLDITAVDPLAPFYADMAARYSIERPIPTVQAFAEDLTAVFRPNSFDVAHCCNALDHSFDPIRGIEEMLTVVRPGGVVCLRHSRNEAEFEQYSGFHQWNFDADNGDFVVWNKMERVNVTKMFVGRADIRVHLPNSIIVTMHKSGDFVSDLSARYRSRTASLLSAFLQVSASNHSQ